jgi:hypothetical protein
MGYAKKNKRRIQRMYERGVRTAQYNGMNATGCLKC